MRVRPEEEQNSACIHNAELDTCGVRRPGINCGIFRVREAALCQTDVSCNARGVSVWTEHTSLSAHGFAHEGDWCRVRKVGQLLIKHPCLVNVYRPQSAPTCIRVIVDSDHTGEPLRRSTTGALTMLGNHCLIEDSPHG
eukprot:399965-Amphidinium_carterae.1